MTLKATWLWNGISGKGRVLFGFSESWYTDDAPGVLFPKMQTLAGIRATILAKGTYLYGFRVADVAPNSRAFTQKPSAAVEAPADNDSPNVPQDAALAFAFGTLGGSRKRFWMHDLPDGMINDSDFTTDVVNNITARWIAGLANNGFKFRIIDQGAPTANILSIDAAGNVKTNAPIAGIAVSSVVQLLKVRGVDGRGKTGKYYVDTVTSGTQFKLLHWAGDIVNASGKIRLVQFNFTSIVPPALGRNPDNVLIRPGTRKCGRPFGQLRGRAVARR